MKEAEAKQKEEEERKKKAEEVRISKCVWLYSLQPNKTPTKCFVHLLV